MDSTQQKKKEGLGKEQDKELNKNDSKQTNQDQEGQESSQKTQQKEMNKNKKQEEKNSLFSGKFEFDKNKIQMNLFNNNKKSVIAKPEKIDPNQDDNDNDNEEEKTLNKKIDNSNNQENKQTSIFGNSNVKKIFSNDKSFFGVKASSGSLFNNNNQSIFQNNDTKKDEKQGLFSNNKTSSIFSKPSQNIFSSDQKSTQTFFKKDQDEQNNEVDQEKEAEFTGKFKTTKLEKVEQVYPFDILVTQKIEKIKEDDEEPIEGGTLTLERFKDKGLHFVIIRSANKRTLHNSIYLKNFSYSKISEKNPVVLMIKTFKVKKQENLKKEEKEAKNIEKVQKEKKEEKAKDESEKNYHFLKIKFSQPEEAKTFHEALVKIKDSNQLRIHQFQKIIILIDAKSPPHQLQDPTNKFNDIVIRITTKRHQYIRSK